MRTRYRIHEPHAAHFITGTIVQWLPVFATSACADILVQSLLHCRANRGLKIYGWVILDTHFHAVLGGPELEQTIMAMKRHTALVLLEQVKAEGREWLMNQLAYYKSPHKTASRHQVWQEGVHPQAIMDDAMMEQKLTYIHNNPVKRGWVASPEHWRYTSAHEWLGGAGAIFKCDDWR